MMAILKTGYQLNGKVPKINTNTLRQEFFFTYGLKIIISEKSMSLTEAKGVHDRTFSFTAYAGDSVFDIKETLNPQGNLACKKRLNDLLSFRKLLLIYRLVHFKDPIVDIETGLRRRNRELVKPLLQLFYYVKPEVRHEITTTLECFLKAKQRKTENTIEAALCPIIINMVSEFGKEIPASQIWGTIIGNNGIDGYYDERRPNEFQAGDFGMIYRNTITNVICGALRKHTEKGSVLIFNLEKLVKVGKSYDLETKIQLKLLEDAPDDPDASDGFNNTPTETKENRNTEVTNNDGNSINIFERILNNDVNNTKEKNENPSVVPLKSSEPSDPSVNIDSNDKNKSTITANIDVEGPFSCPHCSNFETKIENEYQRHVVTKHPGKPGYPNRTGARQVND
jgi:hypothetical protein